jgi:hypothetical protein
MMLGLLIYVVLYLNKEEKMDGTIIQQGRFTSDGTAVELQVRSDIDWMRVLNYTIADADQTTAVGVEYYWQRGMSADTGIEYKKSNAANAANLTDALASGGFTLLDTSGSPLDTLNATISGISTAATPVVTNTGTNGLVAGDVVRLTDVTSAQQLGGFDFTVGNGTLSGTTFSLDYMSQLAVAGTTGSWRKINWQSQFYPRHRYITKLTQATSAVVTLSVTHGFTAGQAVRFIVPSAYGMTEINSLVGNITAISTTNNTITVDIDSSAFTAFAFPATADVPFTPALVVPIGETADGTYANNLDDATYNTSFIGMKLAAGTNSPAGSSSDVIYWRAGKSFSVSNS